MNLRAFSLELMDLFTEMSVAFSETQKKSTLACPTGCGYCCKTPTVEATVMEMIPMALALYDQGLAEEIYERIQTEQPLSCVLYEDHGGKLGRCTQYTTRPSLCRVFGVAGSYNKKNEKTLSICKELKAHYPDRLEINVAELKPAMMRDWTSQLMTLHPELSGESLPISISLGKALEKFMLFARLNESN